MKPATSKLEIPLAALSFFLLGLAAQRWRAAVVIDVSSPPMIGVVAEARASADRDSLDPEYDLVVRSDLFRLDRSTAPRLDTVVRLPAASGVPRILAVETIGYAISWIAFPLLVLPLARWLGREDRFLAFMVAYNWCQVPQTLLFVILGADTATGLLSAEFAQIAEFAAAVAVLVYEWYIARVALVVSPGQAVPVVLLDLLLGTVLGRVTAALY